MSLVTNAGRWINSLHNTVNPSSDWHEMETFAHRLTVRATWHTEKRFTMLRMRRILPPRMIWLMVVHSSAPHAYIGYRWFTRKYPHATVAAKKGKLLSLSCYGS